MKPISAFWPRLKSKQMGKSRLFTLGALITVFVLALSTFAGAAAQVNAPAVVWGTPIPVDSPPFFQLMSDHSMRYKSDGTPCIAYGGDHLYYACYDKVAKIWKTDPITTPLDGDPMVGSYASLDFNNANNPFISYYDSLNGALKLVFKHGGIWYSMVVDDGSVPPPPYCPTNPEPVNPTAEELAAAEAAEEPIVDPVNLLQPWRSPQLEQPEQAEAPEFAADAGGVGKYSSIFVDTNNQVHISYFDEDRGILKYAFWNGVGLPQIEVVDYYCTTGGDVGQWTSIAVDAFFKVHIAYMSEKYDDLKYALKKTNGLWYRETVDGGLSHVGTFASIALDKFGYPHISYLDFGGYKLKYVHMTSTGWQAPVVVDNSGSVGLFTSIAINSKGHKYISYYDITNGDLKYAVFSGSWKTYKLITAGNVGLFTSIDIDKDDLPGISFVNLTQGALQFVGYDGNKWVTSDVGITSDVGLSSSLALNFDGVPFISYMNDTTDQLKYARAYGDYFIKTVLFSTGHAGAFSSLKLANDYSPRIAFYDMDNGDLMYAFYDSTKWVYQKVDTSYDVGQYVSLALDADNNPHISYYDVTHGDLNYAYWNPTTTTWITKTLDYYGDVGMYSSIIFDAVDKPTISYYDATNGNLKRIFKSFIDAWVDEVVDYGTATPPDVPNVGLFTSIAKDSSNTLFISYYDMTNRDLKYAYQSGGGWVSVVMDGSPGALSGSGDVSVGLYTSVAIDTATDNHHICYYDATNGDLKFANWDGVAWTFTPIVTLGDVGQFCSLALDGAGRVGISYYDASMGDLMLILGYPTLPDARVYLPLTIQVP